MDYRYRESHVVKLLCIIISQVLSIFLLIWLAVGMLILNIFALIYEAFERTDK